MEGGCGRGEGGGGLKCSKIFFSLQNFKKHKKKKIFPPKKFKKLSGGLKNIYFSPKLQKTPK